MFWLLACTAPSVDVGRAPPRGADANADTAGTPLVEVLPGADAPPDVTDTVFDPTLIHTVSLTLAPEAWADIRDNPWGEVWYPATVEWGGETLADVGVRAFGAGSVRAGKPGLKVSFDKYVEGQEFRALDELKLDASSQDPGFLNEYVAGSILRRFGLPAARTGWARVAVNGAPAGFFTVLEGIDDRFVERWYGHDEGVLYGMISGRYGQGLNPMEDGLAWYETQTSVTSDGADLVALADLVATGSDADLAAAVDLPGFGRESVARSVLGSMDAFSADGNNFYLYDDNGVWRVLSWDFDVDMGGYYFNETLGVNPRAPWEASPWSGNPITGADYTDPVLARNLALGLDVDGLVAEMIDGALDWATLDAEITAASALIRDDVYADPFGYGPAHDQRRHDLRLWLHTRLSALAGRDVAPCADLDGGVRLADMAPTGSVGWGELLVDRTNWGPGFTVAGRHFCTGVFAHAPSAVALTVPEGVTRLTGSVGLQDWAQRCGDGAAFAVVQGGATLWDSGTRVNYDDPVAFDVPVTAGPVLLRADINADYACDTAVWADVTGW